MCHVCLLVHSYRRLAYEEWYRAAAHWHQVMLCTKLEGLEFAEDIALLYHTQDSNQKSLSLNDFASIALHQLRQNYPNKEAICIN